MSLTLAAAKQDLRLPDEPDTSIPRDAVNAIREVIDYYSLSDEPSIASLTLPQNVVDEIFSLFFSKSAVIDISSLGRLEFRKGNPKLKISWTEARRSFFGRRQSSKYIVFDVASSQDAAAHFLHKIDESCGHERLGNVEDAMDAAYEAVEQAFVDYGSVSVKKFLDQIDLSQLLPHTATGIITCLMMARHNAPFLEEFLQRVLKSSLANDHDFRIFVRRKLDFLTWYDVESSPC